MSQSMSAGLKLLSSAKCFGGYIRKYEHTSAVLGGLSAKFSVFLPPAALNNQQVPVLYWLSGLTCNEDNFMQKAGAQQYASEYNIALIAPDTSPRGANIDGENESYDFGTGAGFYVNATETAWDKYYNMYDYINDELPNVLSSNSTDLPLEINNASIFGHSMGGHGAFISYLRNPLLYQSVSAFSPICNPINCRWGQKCFNGYLGNDINKWKQYDSTELLTTFNTDKQINILIDQGDADSFLTDGDDNHNQLLPDNFLEQSKKIKNVNVDLRWQKGYDHSYFFISSFVKDHIEFHAQYLNK